jgi:DNA invertase Pin-like site-specific DNA recombinase
MVDSININLLNICVPTIIYSRSSTKKQNNININSASINTQCHSCKDFCKNNNLEVKFMRSETCSAKNKNNQKKLLEIIEQFNNINLVIFDVSRFSRNILNGTKMIEKCFENNITVYFVKENIQIKNQSDLPKFTSSLINAHIESDTISYRLNQSIKYRKSIGNKIGKPRYGFTKIKENNISKFVENEKEQIIIKIILKLKFGGLISDLDKLTIKLINKNLLNIDRTDNIIMYGNYNDSNIAYLLNYNGIKYKENEWVASKVTNIINHNLMEQTKIENILDEILFEFSKFLTPELKLEIKEYKKIYYVILNKISEINGYKIIKDKKYEIKNCNSIYDIKNILNIYKVNFRVWTEDNIIEYIKDYIKINKKRKVSNINSI